MKDLVDNDLNIGDNCYYIMNSKSGWSLSIIKIVELKPKTVIGRVVNTNPSASHTHIKIMVVIIGLKKVIGLMLFHHSR